MDHDTPGLLQQSLVLSWAALKATCFNLLPGGVTLSSPSRPETKHKICSLEINLTTGEIKRRWGTSRQPAVSHSVRLFFSPAASFRSRAPAERRGGSSVTFTYRIVFPPATMQNQHVKGVHGGAGRGRLWPWRAGKRDARPELPANPALPCWHRTSVYHLCLSGKALTGSSRMLRVPAWLSLKGMRSDSPPC